MSFCDEVEEEEDDDDDDDDVEASEEVVWLPAVVDLSSGVLSMSPTTWSWMSWK